MFFTQKLWIRDRYQKIIVKQFNKLPVCVKYPYVADYLKEQVKVGNGNYFKCLIESFEKGVDK